MLYYAYDSQERILLLKHKRTLTIEFYEHLLRTKKKSNQINEIKFLKYLIDLIDVLKYAYY